MAILPSLSPFGRLNYGIIRGGINAGLSTNRILEALSASGQRVRRTVGLADVRAIRDESVNAGRLRFTRKDRSPDPGQLDTARTAIRRNFSFDVKLTGTNLDTGETETRWVTVSIDEVKSRQALEDIASDYGRGYRERENFEITSAQLWSGRKAGEMGTL